MRRTGWLGKRATRLTSTDMMAPVSEWGSEPGPPATHHPFVTESVPIPRGRDPLAFFGRIVVALVSGLVCTVAAIAITIGRIYEPAMAASTMTAEQWGPFTVLVSFDMPPVDVVVLSLLAIAVIACCAVGFEVVAALMTVSPRRAQLASLRRESVISIVDPPPIRITVLIPAHDEEVTLPVTLAALARQTRPPDRIIVIADNCTDRTVAIARDLGHEAFETVDNAHKKGGALNQALGRLLPLCGSEDAVLVMDADTSLNEKFVETAARLLEQDSELAAVGGVFYGEPGFGLIGQFQRNEYTRYSLQIQARRGRVFVLTGTATMFRATAMKDVAAARSVYIPGAPGQVYDTSALTEDNELTLALKSLGATMTSPPECTVVTELMPNWRALWRQRQRWQRGALENLGAYGVTRATIRYWGQQVGIGYGTFALNAALLLMLITALSVDQWIWFAFWTVVGAIFLAERVITAWRAGWRGRLLAATLIPELIYDVYLQAVFISCLFDIAVGRTATWGAMRRTAAKAA